MWTINPKGMIMEENEIILEKYTRKGWIKSAFLGFFIGLAVIVPGISGSTIAILFKLYDKLIYAISNLFKKFKICLIFLIPIIIGLIIGFILGFFTIKELLNIIPFAIVCLFSGLMIGSAPSVFNEIKGSKVNYKRILLLIIGIIIPILISVLSTLFIKDNTSTFETILPYEYPLMIILGFVVSITQLVPGLSATSFLMSVGYFNKIMSSVSITAISNNPLIIVILLCLVIGFVIGLFVISKLINFLFKKMRTSVFYMISGFVVGSIVSMFYNPDIYQTYLSWANGSSYVLDVSLGIPFLIIGIAISLAFVIYEFKKACKTGIKNENQEF